MDKPENTEQKKKVKVIAIAGPTGTGKTALSIKLAKALDGEVISCDSMQVYKGMDIGTAKVTPEEMDGVRHHLVDIQEYDDPWNVKIFQDKCREAIDDITSRGKVPILCGGTGLYMKSVLYDYEFEEEEYDQDLIDSLWKKSNEELVDILKEKDPGSLEKIHPNNKKRLVRAALMALSGQAKSEREKEQKHEMLYDAYIIGLTADKELVDKRIKDRVQVMFDNGLPEEAARLFSDPKSWEFTSFQGIGYKEFKEYFEHRATLDEVKEAIYIHSRQYAKRQMTWFRNQMPVHWYELDKTSQILQEVSSWYYA